MRTSQEKVKRGNGLKSEAFSCLECVCDTFSMIEQKFTNKARLIGYAAGALVVVAVLIVKLIVR